MQKIIFHSSLIHSTSTSRHMDALHITQFLNDAFMLSDKHDQEKLIFPLFLDNTNNFLNLNSPFFIQNIPTTKEFESFVNNLNIINRPITQHMLFEVDANNHLNFFEEITTAISSNKNNHNIVIGLVMTLGEYKQIQNKIFSYFTKNLNISEEIKAINIQQDDFNLSFNQLLSSHKMNLTTKDYSSLFNPFLNYYISLPAINEPNSSTSILLSKTPNLIGPYHFKDKNNYYFVEPSLETLTWSRQTLKYHTDLLCEIFFSNKTNHKYSKHLPFTLPRIILADNEPSTYWIDSILKIGEKYNLPLNKLEKIAFFPPDNKHIGHLSTIISFLEEVELSWPEKAKAMFEKYHVSFYNKETHTYFLQAFLDNPDFVEKHRDYLLEFYPHLSDDSFNINNYFKETQKKAISIDLNFHEIYMKLGILHKEEYAVSEFQSLFRNICKLMNLEVNFNVELSSSNKRGHSEKTVNNVNITLLYNEDQEFDKNLFKKITKFWYDNMSSTSNTKETTEVFARKFVLEETLSSKPRKNIFKP